MIEHAVLIAGGGRTGLMLAGELALAHVDVAIVERRARQGVAGMRAGGVVLPVLREVDLLFANDWEAERLTGIELRPAGSLQAGAVARAARALVAAGVREWVILHFPEGVCAASAEGRICWQPSLAVPPGAIKGASGAGDALAAGVLFALHAGGAMEEALRLGVCAAASSLFDTTCSDGVRPASECLRLAETFGYRTIAGVSSSATMARPPFIDK